MPPKPIQALQHQIRLIEDQLQKIDFEIQERKATSERTLAQLKDRLEIYQAAKSNPHALTNHSGEIDYRKAKEYVQRLIRQTRNHITAEEVACWNDIQKLTWEKRHLEREKSRLNFNLHLLRGGENDPQAGL